MGTCGYSRTFVGDGGVFRGDKALSEATLPTRQKMDNDT